MAFLAIILISGCTNEVEILNQLNEKNICIGVEFASIKRIDLSGPGFLILKENLCPSINEYESNRFWQIKGIIDNNKELVILVDNDLNIVCKYILDKRAAPGIMPFEEEMCNE